MTKVSTNAGKNPYSRSDFNYYPIYNPDRKAGLKLDMNIKPKFKTVVSTEYKDKKGMVIHFNDVVTYKKNDYRVKYNSKEFFWIIEDLTENKNTLKLSEIVDFLLIKTKYNKIK